MSSEKVKKVKTGIFIDGANIFWAGRKLAEEGKERWVIDFQKLKAHLKKHYSPVFYKFYNCVDTTPTNETFKNRAVGADKFHKKLSGYGYDVILKPLKYLRDRKTGIITTKGDMDVAISIDIKNSLNDVDNVILFSGDSDFLPVIQDAHSQGKHIRIYSFKHTLAWELKDFAIKNARCNYKLLDELKGKLEYVSEVIPNPINIDK